MWYHLHYIKILQFVIFWEAEPLFSRSILPWALGRFVRGGSLACYGWADTSASSGQALDPDHGLHANERGQMRFTISPAARREILRRLLALNLEIAAREATTGSSS